MAAPFVLYLYLLMEQAYSVRQAAQVLDRVEILRRGQLAEVYDQAIKPCAIPGSLSFHDCEMVAGPFRSFWIRAFLAVASKFHSEDTLHTNDGEYRAYSFLNRIGLRWWSVKIRATIEHGSILRVLTEVEVIGKRSERMSASWELAEYSSPRFKAKDLNVNDRRTMIEGTGADSYPLSWTSGESVRIGVTSDSTEKELQARYINRGCLSSRNGCDGVCDLLPNLLPVLHDRNIDWKAFTQYWRRYPGESEPSCHERNH